MKKFNSIVLTLSLSLALGACGTVPAVSTPMNAMQQTASTTSLKQTLTSAPSAKAYKVSANNNSRKITVFQPTAVPGPKTVRVKTAKAHISRDFKIIDQKLAGTLNAGASADPQQIPDHLSDWVLVIGSYYPKGVYQQPDAGSRIMLRVAPGSRLRLDGKVEGWLKVETDKGSGYIRRSDAEILRAKKSKTNVLAAL